MQDVFRGPSEEDRRELKKTAVCMLGHLLVTTGLFMVVVYAIALAYAASRAGQMAQAGEEAAQAAATLGQQLQQSPAYETAIYALQLITGLLAPLPFLLILKNGPTLKKSLGTWGVRPGEGARFVLLAVSVNAVGGLVALATELFFNRAGYSVAMEIPFGESKGAYVLMLIYVLAVGPLVEELIFRGLLMNHLLRFGERFAVYATAVLFALMHGNLSQFAPALLTGLVLGYVRVKSGSLRLTMLAHLLNNLWAVALSEGLYPAVGPQAAAMLDWTLVAVLVIMCAYLHRRVKRQWGPLLHPRGLLPAAHYLALYANFPMILYMAVCLWNMASAVSVLS